MILTPPHRFRWVFCQLEALRYCFPPSVRHMLEELPETLDETYERILRDINKANRVHAHRLLQCLTVAIRPLRVAELAEILAVDFGTADCGGTSKLNMDWRWADQQQAVLSTCSSLISIVDEDGFQVVQFSHFSVKEFLTSSRLADSSTNVSRFHILLEPAHTILAKACLSVLLRLDEPVDMYNVKKSFPLVQYAAQYWVDHAQFENVASQIQEGIKYLFDPDEPYFTAWLQVHDIDTVVPQTAALYHFAVFYEGSNSATPLYYAALCGFHDVAEYLIMKRPQQVNANGGHYVSPLGAALGREHLDVAQLLYEHGADIDIQGNNGWTPLFVAPCRGRREIAEWLLSRGADPNFRSEYMFTPLHEAVVYGEVEISRILLKHKAEQNAVDYKGHTPLHLASEQGHNSVARLLLEHGADVNTQDLNYSTALHLASVTGKFEVVRLLLERGVDANAQNYSRSTALHLASRHGKLEVACLLLEHGADLDAKDDEGKTAFQVASGRGHHDIAKLLSK